MVRPTLIDFNPVEFKYYSFMIILDKCSGSCNFLSPRICVAKETNDINVKAFNVVINKNEAKAMTKHISQKCKFKFSSKTCHLNQKWNNKACQRECKNYRTCKKDCSWSPSTSICENNRYLKSVADTLVIVCHEIITVMDNVSTKKKTNTIAINVTSTASINGHSKKVRDCYILHTVSLGIILLIIIIICHHYAKEKGAIQNGK